MIHISILVPKAAILGSLEGTRQLFTQVNQFCKMRGMPPLFKVQLVGLDKETTVAGGLYTVNADVLLKDIKKTNLIVIPAIDGEPKNAIEENSAFIPWITKQYKDGAEVASLCLGAFLLASTGLLNGKKCATHWGAANEFRKMFPEVELITEKIIKLRSKASIPAEALFLISTLYCTSLINMPATTWLFYVPKYSP